MGRKFLKHIKKEYNREKFIVSYTDNIPTIDILLPFDDGTALNFIMNKLPSHIEWQGLLESIESNKKYDITVNSDEIIYNISYNTNFKMVIDVTYIDKDRPRGLYESTAITFRLGDEIIDTLKKVGTFIKCTEDGVEYFQ